MIGWADRVFVDDKRANFFDFSSSYFLWSTSLLQVFLDAESVLVAEPEIFALVSVAAERSAEVAVAAEPGGLSAVALEVPAPGVVPVAAAHSPWVAWAAEPWALFAVAL